MGIVLEFFMVLTIAILPNLLGAIFILTNKDYLKHFLPWQRMVSSGVHDVAKILLLTYIAMNHESGLAAIGLSFTHIDIPRAVTVSGLATVYLSLIFVIQRFHSKKEREKREQLRQALFEAGGFSGYKSRLEKCAYLLTLWLAVIAEDLVFRGYLVLGLGARTGTYWPWMILSLLLSVAVHLYQGLNRQIILTQVFFALVFIVVSLITGNVIAAIIPHLVYDTIWVLQGWAMEDKRSTA